MGKSNVKKPFIKLEEIEEVINVYLEGLYTFFELDKIFQFKGNYSSNLLNNKELIEKYFGEQIFNQIRSKASKVQRLSGISNKKELVRNHEIRRLIKNDILHVDPIIHKSLNIAMLFIKYEADLDVLYENTNINKNELVNILNFNSLDELLLPEVNFEFKRVLEIETALFRRDCISIDKTIERIVYMNKVLKYENNTIGIILGLPTGQVSRILEDAYTIIKYKKYSTIEVSDDEIQKQKTLDIYDIITKNDLSIEEVLTLFNLSEENIVSNINIELCNVQNEKIKKYK